LTINDEAFRSRVDSKWLAAADPLPPGTTCPAGHRRLQRRGLGERRDAARWGNERARQPPNILVVARWPARPIERSITVWIWRTLLNVTATCLLLIRDLTANCLTPWS